MKKYTLEGRASWFCFPYEDEGVLVEHEDIKIWVANRVNLADAGETQYPDEGVLAKAPRVRITLEILE